MFLPPMRSTAWLCRRQIRQCNAAMPCPAHRTATGTASNAARPCRPCTRLFYSQPQRMLNPSHLFSSPCCRGLVHRKSWIPGRGFLRRIAMRRLSPQQRSLRLFAFSQPSSRLAASRAGVPRHITFCGKEKNEISKRKRSWAALGARFGSSVAFCLDSKRARSRSRDSASAVPWRRTDLLQLHFRHPQSDLHRVRKYSLDGTPYVFARG